MIEEKPVEEFIEDGMWCETTCRVTEFMCVPGGYVIKAMPKADSDQCSMVYVPGTPPKSWITSVINQRKYENSNAYWYKELINDAKWRELSVRSRNCLNAEGITTLWQLVSKTERELLRTPNFGRKSLRELQAYLRPLGLYLNMSEANYESWLKQKEIKENEND